MTYKMNHISRPLASLVSERVISDNIPGQKAQTVALEVLDCFKQLENITKLQGG
jgi:hypothetical protein